MIIINFSVNIHFIFLYLYSASITRISSVDLVSSVDIGNKVDEFKAIKNGIFFYHIIR